MSTKFVTITLIFTLSLLIINRSTASPVVHQAIYPTCKITTNDRVVLEVLLATGNYPAFLFQPTEVSIVGNDIIVNIFLGSGFFSSTDEIVATIELGKFPTGSFNYLLIINYPNLATYSTEGQFTVSNSECIYPSSITERIFWLDYGGIKRTDQVGRKIENLAVSETLDPFIFDIDTIDGKMYWSDFYEKILYKSNLDGTFTEEVILLYDLWPRFIYLNFPSEQIYGVSYDYNYDIFRVNFDGSNFEYLVENLIIVDKFIPDLKNKQLYWVVRNRNSYSKIQRLDLDKTNVETLVSDLPYIEMLTLDIKNEKIYWAGVFNSGVYKIQYANLDGTEVRDVIDITSARLREFVIDQFNNKILWTGWRSNYIHRASLDGSLPEVLIENESMPHIMKIDSITKKIYWYVAGPHLGYSTIKRANLDGTNIEDVFTTFGYPIKILIIPNEDKFSPKLHRKSSRFFE